MTLTTDVSVLHLHGDHFWHSCLLCVLDLKAKDHCSSRGLIFVPACISDPKFSGAELLFFGIPKVQASNVPVKGDVKAPALGISGEGKPDFSIGASGPGLVSVKSHVL